MKASEAKKKSLDRKQALETDVKTKKSTKFNGEVKHLHDHLMSKVNEAIAKGATAITPVEFADDRWDLDVVRTVASAFKEDGYNFQQEKHNAFHKLKFHVSWS